MPFTHHLDFILSSTTNWPLQGKDAEPWIFCARISVVLTFLPCILFGVFKEQPWLNGWGMLGFRPANLVSSPAGIHVSHRWRKEEQSGSRAPETNLILLMISVVRAFTALSFCLILLTVIGFTICILLLLISLLYSNQAQLAAAVADWLGATRWLLPLQLCIMLGDCLWCCDFDNVGQQFDTQNNYSLYTDGTVNSLWHLYTTVHLVFEANEPRTLPRYRRLFASISEIIVCSKCTRCTRVTYQLLKLPAPVYIVVQN